MELRHLRYFVAVVEEGSLTTAAELRLRTSQPSLSRQIRDLEYQVGAELLSRSVHGVELTAAGKVFLDHARLALAQVDAGVEGARRAARPARKTFAIGFQTGLEMNWLPRAMRVLRDELNSIQVALCRFEWNLTAGAIAFNPLITRGGGTQRVLRQMF
jgi:LysR family hca operon transcriptional activator